MGQRHHITTIFVALQWQVSSRIRDAVSYLQTRVQSAIFNFQSLLLVILLLICTCTYVRATAPGLIDRNKEGSVTVSSRIVCIWLTIVRMTGFSDCSSNSRELVLLHYRSRLSRLTEMLGERLSPYVALACLVMTGRIATA